MTYSKIIGTGSYLPEHTLTNEALAERVDTTHEWIMQRVGIVSRQVVGDSGDTTASMAIQAAKRAIESAKITPDQIDMILVGTATADHYFPSVACSVQHALAIEHECPAFDLNAACAGFIYGLSVADQYIRTQTAKTVLVIGVDTLTQVVDWTDRSTCVLFGDGAGAVVLQASETPGLLATQIHAAGKYEGTLYCKNPMWHGAQPQYIYMEGSVVFKNAVAKLGEIVEQTVEKAGLQKSDIDWLIPHQANMRIIRATAKKLNLPMSRVVLTIERHGNTSAASIPLALDEAVRQGTVKSGDILMLEAFGAGLAWGAALVQY